MRIKTKKELLQENPLLKSGLRVAVDSCTLIYLNTQGLLEMYCGIHEVLLTPEIYHELLKVPHEKTISEDITIYKKLCAHIVPDCSRDKIDYVCSRNTLSIADRSIIRLFETHKLSGIATDDKLVCRYCRLNSIAYLNTPMIIFALLLHGYLTHEQYRIHLGAVFSMGRYGRFVREYLEQIYKEGFGEHI